MAKKKIGNQEKCFGNREKQNLIGRKLEGNCEVAFPSRANDLEQETLREIIFRNVSTASIVFLIVAMII